LWSSIVAKEARAIKAKPGLRVQKRWPCGALSLAGSKAIMETLFLIIIRAELRRALGLNIHRRNVWAEFLNQIESEEGR
jgi:hypothetical protein